MNDGNQALTFMYLLGVLFLVGSAFMVRRVPMAQGLKMFAAWILIFAAAFVGFTLKDEFVSLGQRVLVETRGGAVQEGETLRIRQSADGHFWVDAELNGEQVRFLIDSGATMTSISAATARRAGIVPSSGLKAMVQTANGAVMVDRARVERLEVGQIARDDFPIHVSEAFGNMNVLGMNFLSTLSGWGVENGWLVLRP